MKVSGDQSEDAFSGTTVRLDGTTSDSDKEKTAKAVLDNSRQQYGSNKADIESYLNESMETGLRRRLNSHQKNKEEASSKDRSIKL